MRKRKPIKPARKCIWCGGGDLSKEHVWSEWTHDIVPPIPDGSHVRETSTRTPANPAIRGIDESKSKQGSTNTVRLRVVCETCNNGWMSLLDRELIPILSPLMEGHPAAVDLMTAKLIARWATMKFMIAEHARIEDVVSPQMERDYLRLKQESPPTWKIWIAQHTGSLKWRGGYARTCNTMSLGNELPSTIREDGTLIKNTQAITFGIGRLLFVAISTQVAGLDFEAPVEFRDYFRRIWPLDNAFLWPPGKLLTERGVDMIASAFDRLEQHPNIRWMPSPF